MRRYHPDYKNIVQFVCWKCLKNCFVRYAIEIREKEICKCLCGCKRTARTKKEIFSIPSENP